MGKKFFVLSSVVALISLSSCSFLFGDSEKDETRRYYSELPDQVQISYYDIFNQEEDFYMVYCYSPVCSHCQEFASYVVPYAQEHPEVPLYFLNIATCPDNFFTDYPTSSYSVDASLGATSLDELQIYATPALVGLKAHVVVFNIFGPDIIREYLEYFI